MKCSTRTLAVTVGVATALASTILAAAPAQAQVEQGRGFEVSTTGSLAEGNITWTDGVPWPEGGVGVPATAEVEGEVTDTVKDGASGVAIAHYDVTEFADFVCEDPYDLETCKPPATPSYSGEEEIGRVSDGVGNSTRFQWTVPASAQAIKIGVWIEVCTIDYSEGGTVKSCSGKG
jgi:hypothetical protein